MKFSIISITTYGDQLNASGYYTVEALKRHIDERVASPTKYREFVVVATEKNGRTHVVRMDDKGLISNPGDRSTFQMFFRIEKEAT